MKGARYICVGYGKSLYLPFVFDTASEREPSSRFEATSSSLVAIEDRSPTQQLSWQLLNKSCQEEMLRS